MLFKYLLVRPIHDLGFRENFLENVTLHRDERTQSFPPRPARFATDVANSSGVTGFGMCAW
jgi:hypothetical protein